MAALSGSFTGKARLQTTVVLSDLPNHELNVVEITGPQKSSDAKWSNARVTYWGIADLFSGSGSQHGYFINDHADGDRDWGTFEGKITASSGQVTLEGTWKFSGGNGKLNGLGGGGKYKGRMISPAEVEMQWEGEYQLAGVRAQA